MNEPIPPSLMHFDEAKKAGVCRVCRQLPGKKQFNPHAQMHEDCARQAEKWPATPLPSARDDAKDLKSLGSQNTAYRMETPTPEVLETFPNPRGDADYIIQHETDEVSTLCPKTGQPDFARVVIRYIADSSCVESKSLKLYLFSLRSYGAFMERITNEVFQTLLDLMKPRWLNVTFHFKARGGIATTVICDSKNRWIRQSIQEVADSL